MAFVNLPTFYTMKYVENDGNLTSEAQLYNDQFWQSISPVVDSFINGIQFPNKTTAEVTAIEPDSPVGTVWFNTSLAKLQVKTASGTIETITST